MTEVNAKKAYVRYFLRYFMHLGVVKVGLFRLAKPEVICQRMIFTKKEVRCKINYRSNLTTPNKRHVRS